MPEVDTDGQLSSTVPPRAPPPTRAIQAVGDDEENTDLRESHDGGVKGGRCRVRSRAGNGVDEWRAIAREGDQSGGRQRGSGEKRDTSASFSEP